MAIEAALQLALRFPISAMNQKKAAPGNWRPVSRQFQ